MIDGLPLHPLLNHFPIVLSFTFFILFCLKFWLNIEPKQFWNWALVFSCLFIVSTKAAEWSGEKEEHRIETEQNHEALEHHEHWGERVLYISAFMLALSILGYFTWWPAVFYGFGATSVAIVVIVMLTGHSGAELVYKHLIDFS